MNSECLGRLESLPHGHGRLESPGHVSELHLRRLAHGGPFAGVEFKERDFTEAEHAADDEVDREAKGPPVILPDGRTVPRLPGYSRWMWDGEFCGAPLPAGNYQIRYSKAGYQTQTTDLVLDRNRQIVASLIPSNLE